MNPPIVLLVDDDEDFLHIAQRAIQREGVQADVRMLHNGAEAVRLLGLDHAPEAPDEPLAGVAAVFVDLNMPGVDGYELLHRIRGNPRTRFLPVIIVSSSARGEDVRRSYELGANSFVVKEFDPMGPGRYLANAVRYWTGLNRVPGRGLIPHA